MKLRFFASKEKTSLQPNYAAFEAGVKRFVGWIFDPKAGEAGGWQRKEEADVVEASPLHLHDYAKACQAGELVPADKETADKCGVCFVEEKE